MCKFRYATCEDCYHYCEDEGSSRGFCGHYYDFCNADDYVCDHFGEYDGKASAIEYVDKEEGRIGYRITEPHMIFEDDVNVIDVIKQILNDNLEGVDDIRECMEDLEDEYDISCWQIVRV